MLDLVNGEKFERVAFGCEQLGGFNWGQIDIQKIEDAISYALERGPFLFDTADCYGKGESEKRLGQALQGHRSKAFILTKFGVKFDDAGRVHYDNSVEYCERALDASLKRLNTDFVDMYLVHWPDHCTPLEDLFHRLESLRADGRIRYYGISNFSLDEVANVSLGWPGFKCFSNNFNIIDSKGFSQINQICSDADLIFLAHGVLSQGLLSGKYSKETKFSCGDRRGQGKCNNFKGDRFNHNLELVSSLRALALENSPWTVAQLAIKFALEVLPQSCSIVGVKCKKQLVENILPANTSVSSSLIQKIRDLSFTL